MSMVSCSGMSDAATFLVSVGPAIQKHVQHACPHTDASIRAVSYSTVIGSPLFATAKPSLPVTTMSS